MIQIRNLVKVYNHTVTAVNNLNLEISSGVIALVGHNGAGKSTLLRLISGVILPTDGDILVDNNLSTSKEAKSLIFFLPDDPFAPKNFTSNQVIAFYKSMYTINEDTLNTLLEKLDLPLQRKMNTYSKGMKRQLFLAIALSIEAQYILLDEAFDGIDPVVLENIKDVILSLGNKGKTIIISSHNLSALDRITDRFIILYRGQLSSAESKQDLSNEYIKYQIYTHKELSQGILRDEGIAFVSFKKIGSIYHIVTKDDEDNIAKLKKFASGELFEQIPIDPDEIITLQMMAANKEGSKSHYE